MKSQKIIAAALAICCMGSMGSIMPLPSSAAEMQTIPINFTECTEYDLGSCDSGYTSTPWIRTAPGKDWTTNVTRYSLLLIGIGGYSSAMNTDGVDYDFDAAFFKSLEGTLQSARTNGATVGIRFRYDDNGTEKPEPADFSQVLRHIQQIGESGLLTEYEDVISFVETGFVGCWGEQWGGKYTSLEHKAQVLEEFLNITPDTIPVVVRTPNTFRQWLKDYCGIETTAADMSYVIDDPQLAAKAARVGLYNDGYMGSDSDLGTYSNRTGETAWMHNAPAYGGEFSGNDEWRLKYTTWQPEFALPEMYYTNLVRINSNIYRTRTVSKTYDTQEAAQARLDEIDALYTACGLGDYDFGGTITPTEEGAYEAEWKWMGYDDFTFDAALDEKLGVSCDNSAFYGETVWQFIRAHLGYRFVLRSGEMHASAKAGSTLEMAFSMENTGFSETPKDKEVEVLLTNGDITYTYPTDINARDWASGTRNDVSLTLTLPQTMPGGAWDVYLRISEMNENSTDNARFCTRLANVDLQYHETLGANYFGSITIDGTPDAETLPAADERAAGYYPDTTPIAIDETSRISFLDKTYTYQEDGHFGFTFLYKVEGITEPMQLGNWYASFTVADKGYSSAYTTYGINTRNQELTEDGYYALHIPFYGCAFNCTDATSGVSKLTALNINDDRNYWSEDTMTTLGGNTNVQITPIAFLEGGPEGYDVTYHLESGDYTYSGTFGFADKLTQNIQNKPAVTALSLLDQECPASYTDENGSVYRLLGFTTKKGDKSACISEDFIAAGTIHLYPYYELDKNDTDLNRLAYTLTNGADMQGVRYVTNTSSGTACIGDGSEWENNSGFGSGGQSIILPGKVCLDDVTFAVTEIGKNAFASCTSITDVTIPSTVTKIGENAFEPGVTLYVYEGSPAAKLLENSAYEVIYLKAQTLQGDVNRDGKVDAADALALNRFLTAQTADIDSIAGDMDGNGALNIFDLILLKSTLHN